MLKTCVIYGCRRSARKEVFQRFHETVGNKDNCFHLVSDQSSIFIIFFYYACIVITIIWLKFFTSTSCFSWCWSLHNHFYFYVNACYTVWNFSWGACLASNKSTKFSYDELSLGSLVPWIGLESVHIIFQKILWEVKNRVLLNSNLPTILSNTVLYIVYKNILKSIPTSSAKIFRLKTIKMLNVSKGLLNAASLS